MTDDLIKRLMEYRPVLDGAIAADRAVQPLDAVRPRSHRRALALVGSIAVAAVGIAALVVVTRSGSHRVSAPSPTSVTTPDTWAWLDRFGAEEPAPKVPDGWQVMDYGDLRFAVPGDWTAPISTQCARSPHGLVLLEPTNGFCAFELEPSAGLTISTQSAGPSLGNPVAVGTLRATLVPADCEGCRPTYRFDNGYAIRVTGADAESILATFTDSGARRVLQSGPELDTTGWQQVKNEGVEFLVPPSWRVLHLSRELTPSGKTFSPILCQSGTFTDLEPPVVYTGFNVDGPNTDCLAWDSLNLSPNDGLWTRTTGQTVTSVTQGTVDGLSVSVLRRSAPNLSLGAVLELRIRTAQGNVAVTIGTGVDAAVARTILHSLRSSPETLDDIPTRL